MSSAASMAMLVTIFCVVIYKVYRWLSRPQNEIQNIMCSQGISGPKPKFLLGNLLEMKKITTRAAKMNSPVNNNLEPRFFPYFADWKQKYGKRFVYWLGTEAVLYVQEPELINEISSSGSFNWGRPAFLKSDRYPLFGNGLIMAEDQDWLHQRRIVGQALTAEKVKGMLGTLVEACGSVLDEWAEKIKKKGGHGFSVEIDFDGDMNQVTAHVISKLLFGSSYQIGFQILDKLKLLQQTIFKANRFVGIPGITRLLPNKKAQDLGAEANFLIMGLIKERLQGSIVATGFGDDLLGFLLSEMKMKGRSGLKYSLTIQDVVDECKTVLIAGQETTKLSLTWTMMLLALNPLWQDRVRHEVMEITGGAHLPDSNMLGRMKTMTNVVKESMRMYPPVSYTVRQAKQDVQLGSILIPKGMSVFINIVGMHADPDVWGEEYDVFEFNPERFQLMGNSKRNAGGFIPFGFGGRICPGEKLAHMEQKVILSMILSRFAFSISPNYKHSPTSLLSIMPSNGMQLILHKI